MISGRIFAPKIRLMMMGGRHQWLSPSSSGGWSSNRLAGHTTITSKTRGFSSSETKDTSAAPQEQQQQHEPEKKQQQKQNETFHFPFHTTNLGLDMIIDKLDRIGSTRKLPEVEYAITTLEKQEDVQKTEKYMVRWDPEMTTLVDSLRLAEDLFGYMMEGGLEHLTSLALLAEARNYLADLPQEYDLCLVDAANLQKSFGKEPPEPWLFQGAVIAQAKAYWLQGDFQRAQETCESLLGGVHSVAVEMSARTGQAVSRLCRVETIDDVFSVRDPFRMVIKALEATPCTALAAAHLNMGVAEAVFAETVKRINQVDAPLDAAMRNWKQGLTVLKLTKNTQNENSLARAVLEARLHTNMAWGMFNMPQESDYVKEASSYASKALAVYDGHPVLSKHVVKEGMGRTLALLAACYHKSGNAVTSEGLFQTAISLKDRGPAAKIEQRVSLLRYVELLREWDTRDSDADKYQEKADEVFERLSEGAWRGKSEIHCSLWFWTPALFHYAY